MPAWTTTPQAEEEARKAKGKVKDEGTKETPGTTVALPTAQVAAAGKTASLSNTVGVPSKPDPHAAAGVVRGT